MSLIRNLEKPKMALQYPHASSARARRGSPIDNQRRDFAQEDLLIVATSPITSSITLRRRSLTPGIPGTKPAR